MATSPACAGPDRAASATNAGPDGDAGADCYARSACRFRERRRAQPGMYEVPAGARVGDALARAGGLLADADPALVNQAETLFDGAQVHVPLPQSPRAEAASTSGAPSTGLSGQSSSTAAGASPNTSASGLINVNTASLELLETLPGIGPSKAAAIIAKRPFNTVEELERVPGIGPKTLATIAPLVKVRD